jgi:hypothetical protein
MQRTVRELRSTFDYTVVPLNISAQADALAAKLNTITVWTNGHFVRHAKYYRYGGAIHTDSSLEALERVLAFRPPMPREGAGGRRRNRQQAEQDDDVVNLAESDDE